MTEELTAEQIIAILKKGGNYKYRPCMLEWHGYRVFEEYFEPGPNGEGPCIGNPFYYLLKGDECRLTTYEEGFEILHILNQRDEELDEEEDEEADE